MVTLNAISILGWPPIGCHGFTLLHGVASWRYRLPVIFSPWVGEAILETTVHLYILYIACQKGSIKRKWKSLSRWSSHHFPSGLLSFAGVPGP